MNDFTPQITDWYRQNKRDLPWRNTRDPYLIWISEVILQQTRVDQGIGYYYRFSERFPTITHFAQADLQEILNLWQGLGYYSRARNMHVTAQLILNTCNGVFPNNYTSLIQLKGIGPYTAAAIASFSFKEPVAVVDGNVYRVLSRFFDIDEPIDKSSSRKLFTEIAQSLIDHNQPDLFNQAIMEFGALFCTPKKPKCLECPINESCASLRNGTVLERPVKSKRTKSKSRYLHYAIFHSNGQTLIQQRKSKDIWQQLWEFPLIETDDKVVLSAEQWEMNEFTYCSDEIIHILSHQRLHVRFYVFHKFPTKTLENWNVISWDDFHLYPQPRLIDRFINEQFVL